MQILTDQMMPKRHIKSPLKAYPDYREAIKDWLYTCECSEEEKDG